MKNIKERKRNIKWIILNGLKYLNSLYKKLISLNNNLIMFLREMLSWLRCMGIND